MSYVWLFRVENASLSEFPCPVELWHRVACVSTAKKAAEMSSAPSPEVQLQRPLEQAILAGWQGFRGADKMGLLLGVVTVTDTDLFLTKCTTGSWLA